MANRRSRPWIIFTSVSLSNSRSNSRNPKIRHCEEKSVESRQNQIDINLSHAYSVTAHFTLIAALWRKTHGTWSRQWVLDPCCGSACAPAGICLRPGRSDRGYGSRSADGGDAGRDCRGDEPGAD